MGVRSFAFALSFSRGMFGLEKKFQASQKLTMSEITVSGVAEQSFD